jgi:hypothetical protein
MFDVRFRLSRLIAIALLLSGLAIGPAGAASRCKGLAQSQCERADHCTWVNSYTTKSGTKVSGYCRAKPKKGTVSGTQPGDRDTAGARASRSSTSGSGAARSASGATKGAATASQASRDSKAGERSGVEKSKSTREKKTASRSKEKTGMEKRKSSTERKKSGAEKKKSGQEMKKTGKGGPD